MKSQELNDKIKDLFKSRGYGLCPSCDREIDMGDIAWNSGQQGPNGSRWTEVEIQCQNCLTEVFRVREWGGAASDLEQVYEILEWELPIA